MLHEAKVLQAFILKADLTSKIHSIDHEKRPRFSSLRLLMNNFNSSVSTMYFYRHQNLPYLTLNV